MRRAVQCHAARASILLNPTRINPSAGGRSYTFTDRRKGRPGICPHKSGDNATKADWFSLSACTILHRRLKHPAEPFCREERMKINTDSNLHSQIAGPGPAALKLCKEMIALREENSVVVIFAMVLLSHSGVGKRKCVYAWGCLSDTSGLLRCSLKLMRMLLSTESPVKA